MEASGDAAPRKRKSVKLKDHQRKTVSLTTDGDVVVEERKKKKKTKKTKPVAAAATHDATPDTALPAPVPASDADGAGATVETPATADDRIEEGGGKTFAELGLHEALCDACDALGWKAPTPIQAAAIPKSLTGKDIIGLAETGSGKTGAFALPVLHALLNFEGKKGIFCLVLAPTRELAFQIRETFDSLGAAIGLKTAVIIGGIDMVTQAITLQKKPHVIVATPGRIVDHLENTKGFHLKTLQYLIMDEADRILTMDFEEEVDKLLENIPKERTTFLFSATMTSKVQKLQRASLSDPERIEVSSKYQTVDTLIQKYVFVPQKFKDCYTVFILNELRGNSFMIFCSTCNSTQRLSLLLRDLGFNAICLHGQMSQPKRLGALSKFSAQQVNIIVATDVASRGLDIPHVDCVVNYDIPMHSKDYIHRVGRTARAGRSGRAINVVTQYDVELYQRIEHLIGKKLEPHPCDEAQVMTLLERVSDAQRTAMSQLRELTENKKKKLGNFKGGSSRKGRS